MFPIPPSNTPLKICSKGAKSFHDGVNTPLKICHSDAKRGYNEAFCVMVILGRRAF